MDRFISVWISMWPIPVLRLLVSHVPVHVVLWQGQSHASGMERKKSTDDPVTGVSTAGTPESGGWSSRELRRIVQSMKGLNIVGMDIVEVARKSPDPSRFLLASSCRP